MLMSIGNKILETAPVYPSVEIIRKRLEGMDYQRVENLERLRYSMETAVVANLHAGFERNDEMIAFDEMLLDMRVPPGDLTMECRKEFLGYLLSNTQKPL